MEVALCNKIFVFSVGAVGSVMSGFALDCMLTTSLATPVWARIVTTKHTSFVEESTAGQLILDAIEVIHLFPVVLATEV